MNEYIYIHIITSIQEGGEQGGLVPKRIQSCRCAACFQYGDMCSEEHAINHTKDCQLMHFLQEYILD